MCQHSHVTVTSAFINLLRWQSGDRRLRISRYMGGFLNQSNCCKELPVTTKAGSHASGSDEMWGYICSNVNSEGKTSDWISKLTTCSPCSVILQIFIFVLREHVNRHFPLYLSYWRQIKKFQNKHSFKFKTALDLFVHHLEPVFQSSMARFNLV